MIYRDSVWKAARDITGVTKGEKFAVTGTYVNLIFIEQRGGKKHIPRDEFTYCELVSTENCQPVYYLKLGDLYEQYATSNHTRAWFGPPSLYSIIYQDEETIRDSIRGHLSRSLYTPEVPFTIECHNPRDDTWVSAPINKDWINYVRFFNNAYGGKIPDIVFDNLPYDTSKTIVVARLDILGDGFIQQFDVSHLGQGAYLIHEPDAIPLLQLHYGTVISIQESKTK